MKQNNNNNTLKITKLIHQIVKEMRKTDPGNPILKIEEKMQIQIQILDKRNDLLNNRNFSFLIFYVFF